MEYHQTSSHLLATCNGVSDKRILSNKQVLTISAKISYVYHPNLLDYHKPQ